MSEMSLGTRPATRQSWSRDSVREAYLDLKKENPEADRKQLVRLLDELIEDDPTTRRAVADYMVGLCEGTLERYEQGQSSPRPRLAPAPEQIAARQQESVERRTSIKAQVMLLNLPMPNGKLARNCTGEELVAMGGGWVKIGRKIGKHKVLGQELNEQQVQELMALPTD